jgi:RimJ/RimL family protein N-acetyltransferase
VPLRLESETLTIRPLEAGDIDGFVAYRQDPETARLQSWDTTYDAAAASARVARQEGWSVPPPGVWMQLAILDDSGALVGDLALHALDNQPDSFELGFTLAPHARGNGVATNAVRLLLDFVFDELGAHRVVASTDARNAASAAVLLRNGFRQESRQVDGDWFKGEWTTLDGYALLASERKTQA